MKDKDDHMLKSKAVAVFSSAFGVGYCFSERMSLHSQIEYLGNVKFSKSNRQNGDWEYLVIHLVLKPRMMVPRNPLPARSH